MKSTASIAWDPTRAFALCVVEESTVSSTSGQQDDETVTKTAVHELYSHSGALSGFNDYEKTALLTLLKSHEDYKQAARSKGNNRFSSQTDTLLVDLFRQYRAAISVCLQDWRQASEQTTTGQDDNDNNDATNLGLLSVNYSVLHLSNIYLPLLPSSLQDVSFTTQDPFLIEGFVTADTVRYLRHNHIADLDGPEDPQIQLLLTAPQPETLENYWPVVTKLVLRGCLDLAWKLLSKHSLYQSAKQFLLVEENHHHVDSDYVATLQQLYDGFGLLHELLACAPLPAGRTDRFDDPVGDIPEDSRDVDEEAPPPRYYSLSHNWTLSPSDYKFWESSSSNNNTPYDGDVPVDFHPEAAKRKHRQWQACFRNLDDSMRILVHKIPELSPLFSILAGDHLPSCDTWAEQLLAELLYHQPDMRPMNVSTRANRLVQKLCHNERELLFVDPLLHIMNGNAAKAIDLIFSLGAGSGAALPATLLALLFSLFVDAGVLPLNETDMLTDFLCEAAWSIQSTLTSTNSDTDMAAQLAIRLLLPYAEQTNEQGQTIRCAIAQLLEHYTPSSNHYARTMIDLCRSLVEKKSVQILEACTCFLLNFCHVKLRDFESDAAVAALIDGLELEALVLPNIQLGMCYRMLKRKCLETTVALLQFSTLETAVHDGPSVFANSLREIPNVQKLEGIPEVTLTLKTLELHDTMLMGEAHKAVDIITDALNLDRDAETGNRVLRNLHWYFLRCAQLLMENRTEFGVAFDKKGITHLMETLVELTSLTSEQWLYSEDVVNDMERCFAEGLAWTFMRENAMSSKETHSTSSRPDTDFAGMQTSTMHTFSESMQQRFVNHLLDSI